MSRIYLCKGSLKITKGGGELRNGGADLSYSWNLRSRKLLLRKTSPDIEIIFLQRILLLIIIEENNIVSGTRSHQKSRQIIVRHCFLSLLSFERSVDNSGKIFCRFHDLVARDCLAAEDRVFLIGRFVQAFVDYSRDFFDRHSSRDRSAALYWVSLLSSIFGMIIDRFKNLLSTNWTPARSKFRCYLTPL